MRKIGIEASAYYSPTTLELSEIVAGFRAMKEHGYDAVDYQNFVDTEAPLFTLGEQEFEKTLADHRAAAKEAGIEIYQVHGPWRYPPQDATEEERAERFEKMAKSIRGTHLLGCRHFVIHPIMPFGPDTEPDSAAFQSLNHDFFEKLLKVAKSEDVVICLENMPFAAHSIARPHEISAFVRSFNDPHMRMCLDTGHSLILGTQPVEAVREAGDLIEALHVHDNDGRGDQHRMPYYGVCDWKAFSEAVREYLPETVVMSMETMTPWKMPAELRDYFGRGLAKMARALC